MGARILPQQSYLRECLDYDPETGIVSWHQRPQHHFVSQSAWKTWNVRFGGQHAGYQHDVDGRLYIALDGTPYGIARIVWKLVTGEEPARLIDHKDTIPSNNRWTNLRPATKAQNNHNKKGRDGHLKGTTYKGNGRWGASISMNNKTIHLGSFGTKEEAHRAYTEAAVRFYGKFANDGQPVQS